MWFSDQIVQSLSFSGMPEEPVHCQALSAYSSETLRLLLLNVGTVPKIGISGLEPE